MSVEARNWIFGIGLGLLISYLPVFLHFLFIGALGWLFNKVRSPATGILFLGSLITSAAPWVATIYRTSGAYPNIGIQLVSSLGVLLQTIGLVAYVRSISPQSSTTAR